MAGQEREEDRKGEGKIREAASYYYKRRDIQKALAGFSQHREVVPRYFESFGRRPDTLQYESDVSALADKGATSFHCSEELWKDPLKISTELPESELNDLRIGWDLLIDIDTQYLDYGIVTAELLVEALRFHNINSFGVKYSGNRGFHIGISRAAFPEMIGSVETRNLFPEGARAITKYLYEIIKKKLAERVNEISGVRFKDAVLPDLVLVSPRHLFRMPYSLHEKTCLSSIVIKPEQLKNFKPSWAKPELVMPKQFLPEPEKDEARELLIQAMDWYSRQEKKEKTEKKGFYKEVVIKDLTPALYPPCITNILNGIKQDGRKRALFILLNFFKSLKLNENEIEKKIGEWNKKNSKPLREGYIRTQISWFSKQSAVLPPNCDKPLYQEIGICVPDGMCKMIKNPVNYTARKARLAEMKKGRKNGD